MSLNVSKGFTPKNLEVLRNELNRVLSEAGFDNLEFDTGRIKYSKEQCTVPLEIKIKGMETMDDRLLSQMMALHGLKKEGLGGRVLVKYDTAKRKYPFIYEEGGKRYKCQTEMAKLYFAK